MGVRRFFGGLALPGMKPAPAAVVRLPIPRQLRVPLLQHAGVEAEPCVAIGERVARFQCIARKPIGAAIGAPVHAPCAGIVAGVEIGPTALPGTPMATHVLLQVDPDGAEQRLPVLDPAQAPVQALRERIVDAGVVGLGGAGFPSGDKLTVERRLLILNGAECEPVVACDEALLRERAEEVLAGGRLLARIVGATRIVLAMEDRMTSALPAVRAALASIPDIELVLLPSLYPAGGERQLIQAVTSEMVPADGLPRDIGVLVHNVATAVAALRAVRDGEPLVSRWVTAGGDGLAGAGTFEVAIGTPASALVDAVGGWKDGASVLRAGGPMMGTPLPDDRVAVGKTTIAITGWRPLPAALPMPCIRCGDCAEVCPSRLQPQQLHARLAAMDSGGAVAQGLMACIECGACDVVCPSGIPLTAGFRDARDAERLRRHQRTQAEAAKARFEQRNERLLREAEAAAEAQSRRVTRVSGAAAAALAKARAKRGTDAP